MTVPRFWREQTQRYRLAGSECPKCHTVYFPSRSVCPDCRRESVGRMLHRQLSGRAKVVTWTVVYQPADGFEFQTPYVMAIVGLEEGPRVMTQLVDVDPSRLRSGLEVQACFRRIREDGRGGIIYYGYKFRPVRAKATVATDVIVEARPRRTR